MKDGIETPVQNSSIVSSKGLPENKQSISRASNYAVPSMPILGQIMDYSVQTCEILYLDIAHTAKELTKIDKFNVWITSDRNVFQLGFA